MLCISSCRMRTCGGTARNAMARMGTMTPAASSSGLTCGLRPRPVRGSSLSSLPVALFRNDRSLPRNPSCGGGSSLLTTSTTAALPLLPRVLRLRCHSAMAAARSSDGASAGSDAPSWGEVSSVSSVEMFSSSMAKCPGHCHVRGPPQNACHFVGWLSSASACLAECTSPAHVHFLSGFGDRFLGHDRFRCLCHVLHRL